MLYSLALIVFFSFAPRVNAATPTPTPPLAQQAAEDAHSLGVVSSGDANPNITVSSFDDLGGSISVPVTLLWGVEEPPKNSPTYPYYQKISPLMREGLAVITADTAYTAFLVGPSVDLEATYAELFLPPVLKDHIVYAQFSPNSGTEATKLLMQSSPIRDLWLVMLGLATILFALVLIAAGFMVMFRQKIGGQAVVTVGMAIRGLIIGYVGALFSFALGGLFLNISKFLTFFIAKIFLSRFSQYFQGPGNFMYPNSIWSIVKVFTIGNWPWAKGSHFGAPLGAILKGIYYGAKAGWDSGGGFLGPLGQALKGVAGAVTGLIGGMLASLILVGLGIFMIFIGFKVVWKLINVYINMVLQIILAPLIFVAGALPGREATIKQWFSKMFIYAVTPPAMFFLLNFAVLLMAADLKGGTPSNQTMDLISGGTFAGTGVGGIIEAVGFTRIIALVIIMMVPKVEDFLRETFGVKGSQTAAQATAEAKDLLKSTGIPIVSSLM